MLTTTILTSSETSMDFGVYAVIALIILLSAKEILSASEKYKNLASLNLAIAPLLMSFCAIVTFKVMEIL